MTANRVDQILEQFFHQGTPFPPEECKNFLEHADTADIQHLIGEIHTLCQEKDISISRISRALEISTMEANASNEELRLEITERKVNSERDDLRLDRSNQFQAAMVQLATDERLSSGDFREAATRAAEVAAETLGTDRVNIWFLDESRKKMKCIDHFDLGRRTHSNLPDLSVSVCPNYFSALIKGNAIPAYDAQNDPRTNEFASSYLRPAGITSLLDAPIRIYGEVTGVICFENIGPLRIWEPDEVVFSCVIAGFLFQSWINSERKKAEEGLQETAKLLENKNLELEGKGNQLLAQRQELVAVNMELEAHQGQLLAQKQELVAMNIELAEAKRTAEAANLSKSQFLANMSHEIRTPMAAIQGFTELMLDPEQSKDERENCIKTIHRNSEHLLTIINEILDLSKIEAGKMTVEHLPVQLSTFLQDLEDLLKVRAQEKGLAFTIVNNESLPETVNTDPTRLRQIMLNLIGNAIKFTETGMVQVSVELVADPAGSRSLMAFEVQDTGVGLTEAALSQIFLPFAQSDTSMTRKFGGSGLGLTICKHLAGLLGGEITVQSSLGAGSVFRLTIDPGSATGVDSEVMSPGEKAPHIPTKELSTGESLSIPGRVLLAEDGLDNQFLISFILKQSGMLVDIAENGRIAMDVALAELTGDNPFDLILMDMQMPEMDGYTATSELRRQGYKGPIVALTAHAMAEDRQKCLDAGCDDFATKPIGKGDLLALVKHHLGQENQE